MSHVIQPSDFPAVVRVLLDLANRPDDVATTTDHGRLAVIIPDELYERYQQYQALTISSPPVVPKKKGSTKS